MFSFVDMFFATAPTLAIYFFFLVIHARFGSFSPILAIPRILFYLTYTIVGHVLTVVYYLIYAVLSLLWAFVVFNFLQFITGHPPHKNIPFLHLEETVKAQISAIHKEQRRTVRKSEQLIPHIDRWNEANALLMKDIRSAEIIVKKTIHNYEPVPDRARFHTSCVQFRMTLTFAEEQNESNIPSPWAVIRWLRNQDEPQVFEARREANRMGRIYGMRLRAFRYLQREHEGLRARLRETEEKRDGSLLAPEQPVRPSSYRHHYCQRTRPIAGRAPPRYEVPEVYQEPIVSEFSRRVEEINKYNGQVMHWCHHCDERHFWLHQYNSLGAALNVPQFYPCPAAMARHARMSTHFGLVPPPQAAAPSPPIYAEAPGLPPAAAGSFFSVGGSVPAPTLSLAPTLTQSSSVLPAAITQQAAAPPPPPPPHHFPVLVSGLIPVLGTPPQAGMSSLPALPSPPPTPAALPSPTLAPMALQPLASSAISNSVNTTTTTTIDAVQNQGRSLLERITPRANGQGLLALGADLATIPETPPEEEEVVEEEEEEEANKENSEPRGRTRERTSADERRRRAVKLARGVLVEEEEGVDVAVRMGYRQMV